MSRHYPSIAVSKSQVLAGVQDAYWSDDENNDADCPLCLEEMDISEINFKPCPCGYQICRFCWNHIKQNLNGRCPACRREYMDEAVQFKAIAPEDHKRLMQQKRTRERERKELEALNRKHLAEVRVVQRNVVYVVGLGPKLGKEESIPILRSTEYFGQYGKITKILLVKRAQPGDLPPIVGVYVTFARREDATRAVEGVDGMMAPGGGNEVMRASFGTSKYCMSFLRDATCPTKDNGCMDLHEWGDERDCFTKKDLTTLQHATKDTELRGSLRKSGGGSNPPPRISTWGSRGTDSTNGGMSSRQTARNFRTRTHRTTASSSEHRSRLSGRDGDRDRPRERERDKDRPLFKASSSRVEAPAPSFSVVFPSPPPSPMPPPEVSQSLPLTTTSVVQEPVPSIFSPPDAPPGLPIPVSYQMSSVAEELLANVKARRELTSSGSQSSPFPDFDRTLHNVGDGQFSFNLNMDPDAMKEAEEQASQMFANAPSQNPPTYSGSFNPFADTEDSRLFDDLTQRVSRFGFARRRESTGTSPTHPTTALSSVGSPSPMQNSPLYASGELPWTSQATRTPDPAQSFPPGLRPPSRSTIPMHAISRFQPFDSTSGENLVNDDRTSLSRHHSAQTYMDPAILSSRNYSGQAASGTSLPSSTYPNTPNSGTSFVSSPYPYVAPSGLGSTRSTHPPQQHPFFAPQPHVSMTGVEPRAASRSSSLMNGDVNNNNYVSTPASVTTSPALSPADFPALPLPQPLALQFQSAQEVTPKRDSGSQTSVAAAVEPLFKEEPKVVRKVGPSERELEKERLEKRERERKEREKAKAEKEARDKAQKETRIRERAAAKEARRAEKQAIAASQRKSDVPKPNSSKATTEPVASTPSDAPKKPVVKSSKVLTEAVTSASVESPVEPQAPLISRLTKKSKTTGAPKAPKVQKDGETDEHNSFDATDRLTHLLHRKLSISEVHPEDNGNPVGASVIIGPSDISELLYDVDAEVDIARLAFFDLTKSDAYARAPLEFGPLVHALSVLSLGGGSFAANMPSGSIDMAVSSFQQLLETLTQTISDLLRLLPRTTWDDSSSFDAVLKQMLQGDDFLEDGSEDTQTRDDEVAALTLALERRARWMEVQLAKLEELHRDINTAAVRAVFAFNDRGWDVRLSLPRVQDTLARFDELGYVEKANGEMVAMGVPELEVELEFAQKAAVESAKTLRESMEQMQSLLPL